MTVFYERSVEFVAQKLAVSYVNKWAAANPDAFIGIALGQQVDLWNSLFRRAFYPRACAKLLVRMEKRGHEVVRGEAPQPRLSEQRLHDRFMAGLVCAIQQASARSERIGEWSH